MAAYLYESKISDLRGGDGYLMVIKPSPFCFCSPPESDYFYSTIFISQKGDPEYIKGKVIIP